MRREDEEERPISLSHSSLDQNLIKNSSNGFCSNIMIMATLDFDEFISIWPTSTLLEVLPQKVPK